MTKFNVIQKKKRTQSADRKRQLHGHPLTGKIKNKPQYVPISSKRKRKLFKKWRRDQKEAIEKGLITMEDVEMAVSQGPSEGTNKTPSKFPMKKGGKLQLKRLKGKGKGRKTSKSPTLAIKEATPTSVDAMVE